MSFSTRFAPAMHQISRLFAVLLGSLLLLTSGCALPFSHAQPSPNGNTPPAVTSATATEPKVTLREGDVIQVSFPGSPNLNTLQTIRRDGRIVLPVVGELIASGYTPADLSAELARLYAPQLVHKEVFVTLVSSSFSVFVSGAVLRPGRVVSDHPLTALEAIMEAGGFDSSKANLKAVVIIRDGRALPEKLDLKRVLDGKEAAPFLLKPADIVHVPDRLVIF